jgi:DMSO/TMAO reductase YedYZ molybdopterin-dependent catalytic subunit
VQEALGGTTVLVAWEMDGKPLAPSVGPLRLVVPTDKKGTRALYQLVSLEVVEVHSRAK